ncbi:hypothetical protein L1887_24522 [Cichorium endivia]|nr:hypothetical protein L1887_24522 [Cichorium endivia]
MRVCRSTGERESDRAVTDRRNQRKEGRVAKLQFLVLFSTSVEINLITSAYRRFLSSDPYNSMTWRQAGRLKCRALDVESKSSFLKGNMFQLIDVIEAQHFDTEIVSAIFEVAREMEIIEKKSIGNQLLKGYLMATLFYEPSTTTRLSFESAMKRLGGEVLTTENAREFSSAAKGEPLEDTITTIEGYLDIIVMRHFESGAAKRPAMTANIPVINAVDRPGQHPTQALLDVYTIERVIGKLDAIKVGLVGDLANG